MPSVLIGRDVRLHRSIVDKFRMLPDEFSAPCGRAAQPVPVVGSARSAAVQQGSDRSDH